MANDDGAGNRSRPTVRSPLHEVRRPAGPPQAQRAPAPPVEISGFAPPVPVPRPPAALASTAEAVDLPAAVMAELGKLPFRPPEEVSAPKPKCGKTLELPVARPPMAETAPLGDDSIAKAVAAVLPFAGNTLGAGVVPFPRLTVEQYASLRAEIEYVSHIAEIAVRQAVLERIRLRYHMLTTASLEALDEHWQKQLAARPELRAAYDHAFIVYAGWLRSQPP